MGVAKHYLGDQISARRHLEQVLAQDAVSDHGRDVVRFQDLVRFDIDLRVSARVFLARVLWLQGFADQAVRTAEMSLGEAQATRPRHVTVLRPCLGGMPDRACGWATRLAAARYTGMLLDHSRKHGLALWADVRLQV